MKKNSILLLLTLLLTFPALYATEKNDGVPLGMNLGSFPSWEQPVFVDIFKYCCPIKTKLFKESR